MEIYIPHHSFSVVIVSKQQFRLERPEMLLWALLSTFKKDFIFFFQRLSSAENWGEFWDDHDDNSDT